MSKLLSDIITAVYMKRVSLAERLPALYGGDTIMRRIAGNHGAAFFVGADVCETVYNLGRRYNVLRLAFENLDIAVRKHCGVE